MIAENDFLIPDWPDALQRVDIVRARFVLDFVSPCKVQPADFLGLGRVLRLAGRQLFGLHSDEGTRQWDDLFRPSLSDDPVARRKFQKPAPAFVISMPIMQETSLDVGARLEIEVLFIGNGIPLISDFLRGLIHLGKLGLVAGEGRFNVIEVYNRESDCSENLGWSQNEPLETLTCSVQSLPWLFQNQQIASNLIVKYQTPARLMVAGKPLRKPDLVQVFPFMLRRATSMLYAHSGVEVCDDPAYLLDKACSLEMCASKLNWHDWRSVRKGQGMSVGGFVGEMHLQGQALEELYWVFAVASLFGIGKGATYGAGQFSLSS
jgi:hypothetical protein